MRHAILALPALAIGLAACATLPASAETRTFNESGFSEVSASAGVTVILKQGPYAIVASEPDGRFDKLKIEKRGDTLVVGRKGQSNWFGRGPEYTVTVTAPDYSAIGASSGSSVDGANLRLADVKASASSGAQLDLSGSCTSLKVDVSSGASFNGEDLRCERASADASSGASANVYASMQAEGDASSGGSVRVHGKPADFTRDTSSGGSVKAL